MDVPDEFVSATSTRSFPSSKVNLQNPTLFSDVSRTSEISLQIYLRSGSSVAAANGSDDMGKSDLFLGNIKLTPDFEYMVS